MQQQLLGIQGMITVKSMACINQVNICVVITVI